MNDSQEVLLSELKVPLARPWFDDKEPRAAFDVVQSGWVIFGPRVREFEQRFAALLGVEHAIAVNSGSSALLTAMWALGVGPGDEIIAPDMTFVSTASAALFLGARPVFADIELDTYCIDPAAVERMITPRTKAIVPVHYAGHSAEMAALQSIAGRHGLAVLEDAAESHLAAYRDQGFTGTLGNIGIFSFTPSKPMTTGEGGMIVTNDATLAERCRLFQNFGDSDKFRWDHLGFNFRMPEVMAAIGLHQLDKLPAAVTLRREIAKRYNDGLRHAADLILPPERHPLDTNYQLYTLRLRDAAAGERDTLLRKLQQRGVSARLYYPPLHRAKVFAACSPLDDSEYPATVTFAESAFSLPIYPTLGEHEQQYVIDVLLSSLDELR
jgi:perosamine synthetase